MCIRDSSNYGYSFVEQPDILIIENDTLLLNVGEAYMSPLETYYIKNKKKIPFKMLHTANYRGFVATWEIVGDELCLNNIQVMRKVHNPNEFIELDADSIETQIHASWFTGFLFAQKYTSWDFEYDQYFKVKNGKIIRGEMYADADYEKIKNEYERGISLKKIEKAGLLHQFHKFESYFYGLYESCLLYTSPSPRDATLSRMPSSA